MKNKILTINLFILLIITVNIGCDQVSKSAAREHLEYNRTVSIWSSYLVFRKVENPGAFLSLGDDLKPPWRQILLLGIPLAMLFSVLIALFIYPKRFSIPIKIGLAFIIGGGLGNLIDRILYNSVTDFLHIDLGIVKTGIFNVADMSLMFGLGLLIYFQIFPKKTQ